MAPARSTIASSIASMIERIDPQRIDEAVNTIVEILGSTCSLRERETILHDLETLYSRGNGEEIVSMTVTHAHPLSSSAQANIEQTISQWLNRPLSIRYKQERRLIGGLRIEWEGALVRASVLDRLQALTESLTRSE